VRFSAPASPAQFKAQESVGIHLHKYQIKKTPVQIPTVLYLHLHILPSLYTFIIPNTKSAQGGKPPFTYTHVLLNWYMILEVIGTSGGGSVVVGLLQD
jgi:hypothetical protein